MAASVARSFHGRSAGVTSLGVSVSSIASGSTVLVIEMAYRAGTFTFNAPTDNVGNTYVSCGTAMTWSSTYNSIAHAYYCQNVNASGLTTITGNFSTTVDPAVMIFELAGVPTSGALDAFNQTETTADDPVAPAINGTSGGVSITAITHDDTTTNMDPGSGWTAGPENEDASGQVYSTAYKVLAATGSHSMTWVTGVSKNYSILSVSFKPGATNIPLAASSAVASATLAAAAKTAIPLATTSAAASATLALAAQTTVTLTVTSATASATLALTAPTVVPLASSAATSSATLTLTVPVGVVPLAAATATSSATLALSATTSITFNATSGAASATLALTASPQIALNGTSAIASATLTPSYRPFVPLDAASATSTATLAVTFVRPPPPAPVAGEREFRTRAAWLTRTWDASWVTDRVGHGNQASIALVPYGIIRTGDTQIIESLVQVEMLEEVAPGTGPL